MNSRILTTRLIAIVLAFAVSAPVLQIAAQRRPGGTVATANTKTAAAKCSGAWTGTITYTRTQSMTDSKTVQRVSARGEDTRNWEMKYEYKAQVRVLESPEMNGSSIGKGSVTHNFSSAETTKAVEKNSCDRGKTWRQMSGTFTSETKTTASGDVDAAVSVGVNTDGTYSVSVGLPEIKGQTTGKQTSTFSGQCTAKEGKTLTMPPTETTVQGNSLTSDGTHRIDPADPDRLSGTYSVSNLGVTETITWSLRRCGGPLRIEDLKFEHMKFPRWDDWQEISEQTGTIDGNWVKIKAKVANYSGEQKFAEVMFKETYKGDKWDGAKPDMPLKDQTVNVRLDPGEEREVEILWDSSGYAWFDDGRPRLVQRIKSEVWENNKKADELTKNLKIAPKPLVLVHGLWSSWRAWESWQNILTTSHSYDWKAFPVGERPEKGVMDTGKEFMSSDQTKSIAENARELEKYIRYAQEDRNAWHVDLVAHSMGGLISRYYISQIMPPNEADMRPQVSHLVMLGTPNMGSPCADVMDIAFGIVGKQVEAIRQLRPEYLENFNRVHRARKGVKFSVLAGDPLPTMCKTIVWNDGVVPVPSAVWEIEDNARSKNLHTELTGTADFSAFVKPRLAVGPRGDHNPATQVPAAPPSGFASLAMEGLAGGHGAADAGHAPAEEPPFAKLVKLPARGTVEVELPVSAARNVGVTFMASAGISATLFDDRGAAVGKNLAGSREAGVWFRSIYVDRDVGSGRWKLRLENTTALELESIVVLWTDAGP
ncbi:MAG: esterase/lipase family protein [Pyrinomonadaceae bacterium]